MNQPDLESEHIKEVYARFGLSMYAAQCLERALAILLATEYGPGPQRLTRTQFDELLASLFEKSLGPLIDHLRNTLKVGDSLESNLTKARKTRNWLAHRYFWDRAGEFMTETGRTSMIRELQDIADFFALLDDQLTEIARRWAERHGITEAVLQEQTEELLKGSWDRTRGGRIPWKAG